MYTKLVLSSAFNHKIMKPNLYSTNNQYFIAYWIYVIEKKSRSICLY